MTAPKFVLNNLVDLPSPGMITCPLCGAEAGQTCRQVGSGKPRNPHNERLQAARRARFEPAPEDKLGYMQGRGAS